MSGFTFNDPNSDAAPPAELPAADVVKADGWWPDVNITGVRLAVDINTKVTPERLRDSVRQAIVDIAGEPDMIAWRAKQETAGVTKLEDVPSRVLKVDGVNDYCHRWTRAIYSAVGADLGERMLGQGLTSAGADRAEALGSETLIHQKNTRHAVRLFLGKPRTRARLV